jgi:excisionase family DNA binding protein
MITLPEVASRVGRNPETVRRWIRAGRLASRKVGTQYLIDEADLSALLAGETVPLPGWMRRTVTGEPMPDVVAVLRRQRAGH